MRAAPDVERFIEFATAHLDARQLRAVVVSLGAEDRWTARVEDSELFDRAGDFFRFHVSSATAKTFLSELQRRLRDGEPLVRSALLPPERKQAATRKRGSTRVRELRDGRRRIAGSRCERCLRGSALQLCVVNDVSLARADVNDVRLLCKDCRTRFERESKAQKHMPRTAGQRTRLIG
jgi:hypothetical protein